MSMSRNIRTGRHCTFNLKVHLVFVPKYRKKVFTHTSLKSLETLFRATCEKFECSLNEFNGEADHVHLLVDYPPKVAISKLVNSLKGASSRVLKKQHPEILKHYWNGILWSPSYFAGSCGGATLENIKKYIEKQSRPTDCLNLSSST